MSESFTLETPRTARVHVASAAGAAREAWFLLHGYGQLAEPFLASLAALAAPARLLVAPEALSRFYLRRGTGEVGGSWMTRAERAHEIRDVLRYLDNAWERVRAERALADGPELVAFGFSQGGAAAARWAVLGSAPVRRLVSFACPLPPDLDLEAHRERVRRLRWVFALGDADTSIDRAAFEAGLARLRAAGVEPEVLRFAGGHELEPATVARIASGSAAGDFLSS
jgi:predicted esterase